MFFGNFFAELSFQLGFGFGEVEIFGEVFATVQETIGERSVDEVVEEFDENGRVDFGGVERSASLGFTIEFFDGEIGVFFEEVNESLVMSVEFFDLVGEAGVGINGFLTFFGLGDEFFRDLFDIEAPPLIVKVFEELLSGMVGGGDFLGNFGRDLSGGKTGFEEVVDGFLEATEFEEDFSVLIDGRVEFEGKADRLTGLGGVFDGDVKRETLFGDETLGDNLVIKADFTKEIGKFGVFDGGFAVTNDLDRGRFDEVSKGVEYNIFRTVAPGEEGKNATASEEN